MMLSTVRPFLRRAALVLLAPLVLQACGGDSTTTPDNDDTISVALNASSASIAQGGTTNVQATLTRGGGYTGNVTFAVTGAPTGVTAGIASQTTTGGTTTAVVTITAAADAPAGTYNLVVRGTGTGVSATTAPFTLTVTAVTTPNYSIGLAPAAATVAQGGSTNTTATLTRTGGFTGSVNLSLTNAPTGVTATFTPNNTTANTSAIAITVGAAVPAGVYTVYVGGVAAGQSDKVAPFVLTVTPAGSYTLSVPAAASVAQGGSATPAITLTRAGGFNGTVALTATGMPTGMTATFDPSSATGTTSTLTLSASGAVAPGTYPIVVRGNSAGTTEQAATIQVTVTSAASYTLAAPGTATVTQGNSVTPTITLTRNGGFNGNIALTATGMPNGMTASFNPATVNNPATTSVLTLTTTGATPVGTHNITVRSNSASTAEQSVVINVTVNAAGGGGNASVTFADCAVGERPIWFAFQNGTGAWTVVTPVNNVYSFTVNAGTGGFAYVKQDASGNTSVIVQSYTQTEFANGAFNSCPATGGKTITGTAANIGLLDGAIISLGGVAANPTQAASAFTLQNVPNGSFDLVGFRRAFLSPGAGDRAFIRRDQNIASGGSVGTVDFTGADSYAVQTANLTVPNGSGTVFHSMSYLTGASCTASGLYSAAAASPLLMQGFPSAQQRANDYYLIAVTESNGGTSFRGVQESFHTFGARSVSLGSVLATPTVTSLGGPYKRLQSVFTIPADYHASATLQYSTGTTPARTATISASYGVFGGSTGTLALPDFSALSGWNNVWAPSSAQTASSPSTTVAGSTVTSTLCQEGVRIPFASVTTGAM